MSNKSTKISPKIAPSNTLGLSEKKLLKKIKNGFENQEFKMYLQFIVDSKTPKIVSLAHSMGIATIGEGVETEEQNAFVYETDCDCIQGWYYFKGLSEASAEKAAKEYMSSL